MKFKIERGKPIPKPFRGHNVEKYPWSSLKVGESFFVEGNPKKTQKRLSAGAVQASECGKGTFCTRQTDDGVRVWRIK